MLCDPNEESLVAPWQWVARSSLAATQKEMANATARVLLLEMQLGRVASADVSPMMPWPVQASLETAHSRFSALDGPPPAAPPPLGPA